MKKVFLFTVALALVGTIIVSTVMGQVIPIVPKPPEIYNNIPGEVGAVASLTDEERARVMSIINDDVQVRQILDKGTWLVLNIELWTKNSERVGAIALIRLNNAVWFDGTFYNPLSDSSHTAKLWVGSLHVFVDLGPNKIVGLDLGVGRAVEKAVLDDRLAAAERIALDHQMARAPDQNLESYLAAVYYTSEYPGGIAFFSIRSNQGEVLVAVDLNRMAIVEDYTRRVIG